MTDSSNNSFAAELACHLLRDRLRYESGYRDFVRYSYNAGARAQLLLKDSVLATLSRLGWTKRDDGDVDDPHTLEFILSQPERFENLYQMLADDASRRLLVDVMRLRILGMQHAPIEEKLPAVVAGNEAMESAIRKRETYRLGEFPNILNYYEFNDAGAGLRIHGNSFTLRNSFCLEQYHHDAGETVIAAGEGDIVIDGGACWGDTALYFANRIGPSGKVFSFEFDPANIEIFEVNLGLNPDFKDRIEICPFGLWDESGHEIDCTPEKGVSSALTLGSGSAVTAATKCIDDFLAEKDSAIDFIKLDIEGAELRTLKGAEKALQKHKPKLAVCLYHNIKDFVEIPEYLAALDLGYRFYIGHVPTNHEETVLFANPGPE